MTGEPVYILCPHCGAQSLGAPPHGQGQPCPNKLLIDAAYINKLQAEEDAANAAKEYHLRAQMSSLDTAELTDAAMKLFRQVTDSGDDDE